jgi:hypothetical protein
MTITITSPTEDQHVITGSTMTLAWTTSVGIVNVAVTLWDDTMTPFALGSIPNTGSYQADLSGFAVGIWIVQLQDPLNLSDSTMVPFKVVLSTSMPFISKLDFENWMINTGFLNGMDYATASASMTTFLGEMEELFYSMTGFEFNYSSRKHVVAAKALVEWMFSQRVAQKNNKGMSEISTEGVHYSSAKMPQHVSWLLQCLINDATARC